MRENLYENPYTILSIDKYVGDNPYPGRGIICGLTPDGKKAVSAYFIMGRSANSRNRVFEADGDDVIIKPADDSKVEDPSLIVYYPVRVIDGDMIVTNGDQTDTIAKVMIEGGTFEDALNTRKFEPDGPNWTPRISSVFDFDKDAEELRYKMSILKAGDPEGKTCARFYYSYTGFPGLGHFIHTYETDGNPIPTFIGEPERVEIPQGMDAFADLIWNSLNEDNKISLFVRYHDMETGTDETKIVNKYTRV
ncbi:MAG: IMP cyclohydrolase [Eubacteriales bacterium]|nr:IMP cyclohydrolase [Eubacteriales bacterium]